ncbi:nuclear transport factor 2 family protein [Granulicella sp. WH15]|uniref:YybH family protein n=1 Tax=Granulicella sp. WH15 TaxID=2602070 RepID=UPI0013678EB4|nr:nuclear transport factor 2 family protein [Granulicella sp. WH15]QHN04468.1 nuclear transport factor 2 family protein [Granulicella sp. WH15]
MIRTALYLLLAALPLAAPLVGQQSPMPPSSAPAAPAALPGSPVPVNPASPFHIISPITQPTITPGQLTLLELEGRFSQEVEAGGGKAFASWFAEDAVTLNNGKPAIFGRGAIAATAQWNPSEYQLTWTAQGAQMGPSGDMGFTWGHYTTRYKGPDGNPIVTAGRYITVWKKVKDGSWKVAMDASADEPPAAGECCTLPKP